MSLTLYHCHESRSMRTLWLLNELNLDFEVKVMPFDGLRNADYLAIHPLGRVPALVHNDISLFETGAICQYLCEQFSPEILGRSFQHSERPKWLQWLHFSETMAVHGATLVQQFLVLQDEHLRSAIIQKLEGKRLQKSLEVIEQQLKNQPYLLADKFSAVDIAVGYSLHLAQYFIAITPYPNVSAYYQRLIKRPAFIASLPKENASMQLFTKEKFEYIQQMMKVRLK